MKCPFRTIEIYKKTIRTTRFCDATCRYDYYDAIIPCSESEAHTKTTEFADCMDNACPYYENEKCKKIGGTKEK